METVEVVIKIPKEDYEYVKEVVQKEEYVLSKFYYTIANGTVLSKGHWIQQPRCEGDEQPDLVCPSCGYKISWWDMGNFCAKCGKGLEGGAE